MPMADQNHDGSAPRPGSQNRTSQPSIHSITRRPLNSPRQTPPHRRHASDSVSISSRSQLSRHDSTASAQSRAWDPIMGSLGAQSPSLSSPAAWSEGGDLSSGFPMNPASSPDLRLVDPTTREPQQKRQQQEDSIRPSMAAARHSSPSAATPAPGARPRPAPIQFEDAAAAAYDRTPPISSSRTLFSPIGGWFRGPRRTGSHTNLLHTPSTSTTWRSRWGKSPRTPPPPYSGSSSSGRKRWWRWRPAGIMYVLYLVGFAFAVGHHAFYRGLDGRPADSQLANIRYGTALAFACKACLMSAVIVAYRQCIWMTVQTKMLSVAALDSLFAATEDLSALWNLEIYKRAKTAIALAVLVWIAPLVIILTSSTLSVELAFRTDSSTCPGIHTLNFEKEEQENWRTPTKIDNLFGLSVSLYNKTTEETTDPGWFDYYTAYSEPFEQVARMAAYGKRVVSREGATMDICGPGFNCTYVVNFTAPGYKCQELSKGVGTRMAKFRAHNPPNNFNSTLLLPEGNFSYYAYTGGGDYSVAQMKEVQPGGMPIDVFPFPENLGAFRTEPVLWIGYAERTNPDTLPSRDESGWDDAFVPKIFACENYETEYTVHFNHTGGQQYTKVIDRRFLYPVIDTRWLQGVDANDGTNDNTTAYPNTSYVYPKDDMAHYRRVAAFHSIGAMARHFINGTVLHEKVDNPIANSHAMQTKLLDRRHEWFAYPDLMARVQSFTEDIVLSILSNPQFLSVVWAAQPDEISGDARPIIVDPDDNDDDDNDNDDNDEGDGSGRSSSRNASRRAADADTQYPCVRSRYENQYRYYAGTLWAVYGVALLVSALGVASGTRAVLENDGRLRDTRFSSIVAATRGPAFEKVLLGSGAGTRPAGDLPRDVKNLKVGYGLVHHHHYQYHHYNNDNNNNSPYEYRGASGMVSPPIVNHDPLGVTTSTAEETAAAPGTTTTPRPQSQHFRDNSNDAGRWFPERELWDAGDVRYGFGLEGDVSQLRGEGSLFRGRSRG